MYYTNFGVVVMCIAYELYMHNKVYLNIAHSEKDVPQLKVHFHTVRTGFLLMSQKAYF